MLTHKIKPIYLKGSEYGVLLLHGFTGTPQAMQYLGEFLHKNKFTVSIPVLEGHASHIKDLEKTRWEDWYHTAENALEELHQDCEKIFVIGLSMGGLLALHLAQQHPQIVHAFATLATPLYLQDFLVKHFFKLVWYTPLRWIYKYKKKYSFGINDPRAYREYQTYDKIPVASVAQLLELQQIVRAELRYIHQPGFIAISKGDKTVPPGNLDYLKAALGSQEIDTLILKKSKHIITLDYEKELLAKKILKFLNKQKKKRFI